MDVVQLVPQERSRDRLQNCTDELNVGVTLLHVQDGIVDVIQLCESAHVRAHC